MRLILLALALLAPLSAQADDRAEAERLFALGVALAEEGDLAGAAAAFEGALATGRTSPALAFNLARTYYAAGDLGRARLHAERAARLAPRDAEVQALRLRTERAAGEPPARAPTATGAALGWVGQRVPAGVALGLAWGLWMGALGLLAARPLRGDWTKGGRRAVLLLVALAVLALGVAVVLAHEEARPRAVVVGSGVTLRASPRPDAPAVQTLPPGRMVTLDRREGDWQRLRLPDGTLAWAEAGGLARVDA
jgi:tetratricopeptide (TPR) repeat protein